MIARPRLRESAEDFAVDEIPLYEPSGEGGHTFVRVEKRMRTTEEVARALARLAGVPSRDVGYAGRKDRVAVTRQWLSVPALEPERAREWSMDGVRVLSATRHPHKLKTGQLRGNRFDLVVRGVDPEAAKAAAERMDVLHRVGMPNRFGPQRFGADGGNPERGLEILTGRARPRDRRAARFAVSALQARVFNEVLRSRPSPLDRLEIGDVAVLHGSGGWFWVEDLEAEQPRASRFEISPSGPIFGTRSPEPRGAVAERERSALAEAGIPPAEDWRLPRGLRLRGARRALRVRPDEPCVAVEGDALRLGFSLPAGSFASVLVEELLGDVEVCDGRGRASDGSRAARDDTSEAWAVS